eukprot:gene28652-31823_t
MEASSSGTFLTAISVGGDGSIIKWNLPDVVSDRIAQGNSQLQQQQQQQASAARSTPSLFTSALVTGPERKQAWTGGPATDADADASVLKRVQLGLPLQSADKLPKWALRSPLPTPSQAGHSRPVVVDTAGLSSSVQTETAVTCGTGTHSGRHSTRYAGTPASKHLVKRLSMGPFDKPSSNEESSGATKPPAGGVEADQKPTQQEEGEEEAGKKATKEEEVEEASPMELSPSFLPKSSSPLGASLTNQEWLPDLEEDVEEAVVYCEPAELGTAYFDVREDVGALEEDAMAGDDDDLDEIEEEGVSAMPPPSGCASNHMFTASCASNHMFTGSGCRPAVEEGGGENTEAQQQQQSVVVNRDLVRDHFGVLDDVASRSATPAHKDEPTPAHKDERRQSLTAHYRQLAKSMLSEDVNDTPEPSATPSVPEELAPGPPTTPLGPTCEEDLPLLSAAHTGGVDGNKTPRGMRASGRMESELAKMRERLHSLQKQFKHQQQLRTTPLKERPSPLIQGAAPKVSVPVTESPMASPEPMAMSPMASPEPMAMSASFSSLSPASPMMGLVDHTRAGSQLSGACNEDSQHVHERARMAFDHLHLQQNPMFNSTPVSGQQSGPPSAPTSTSVVPAAVMGASGSGVKYGNAMYGSDTPATSTTTTDVSELGSEVLQSSSKTNAGAHGGDVSTIRDQVAAGPAGSEISLAGMAPTGSASGGGQVDQKQKHHHNGSGITLLPPSGGSQADQHHKGRHKGGAGITLQPHSGQDHADLLQKKQQIRGAGLTLQPISGPGTRSGKGASAKSLFALNNSVQLCKAGTKEPTSACLASVSCMDVDDIEIRVCGSQVWEPSPAMGAALPPRPSTSFVSATSGSGQAGNTKKDVSAALLRLRSAAEEVAQLWGELKKPEASSLEDTASVGEAPPQDEEQQEAQLEREIAASLGVLHAAIETHSSPLPYKQRLSNV